MFRTSTIETFHVSLTGEDGEEACNEGYQPFLGLGKAQRIDICRGSGVDALSEFEQ